MVDMVHSGLTASIPGGDEAVVGARMPSAAEAAAYDICASYGQWELEERAAGRSGIPTPDDGSDWTANSLIVCSAISRGVVFAFADVTPQYGDAA